MISTYPFKEVEAARAVSALCVSLEEAQRMVTDAVYGRTEDAAAVAGVPPEAVGSALKVPPTMADLNALRALCRYGGVPLPVADPERATDVRCTFAVRLAVCIDSLSTRSDRVDRASISLGTTKTTLRKWLAAEETANSVTLSRVASVLGVDPDDLSSPGRPQRRLYAPAVIKLARAAHKGEEALCWECHMVPGAFRALMAGACPPPAQTLDRLSLALGASPVEFCHGVELKTVDVNQSLDCLASQARCLSGKQANALMKILDRWFEANQVSVVSLVG